MSPILQKIITELEIKIENHTRRITVSGVPKDDYWAELARLKAYTDALSIVTEAIEPPQKEQEDGID